MNEHQFFVIKSKEIRQNAVNAVKNIRAEPLMSVEIKPYKKNRSLAQNRLYWMWINIFAQHINGSTSKESLEEIHTLFKVRFLGTEERFVDNKKLIIPKSTRTLNTKEFTEYLQKLEMLAVELDLTLPYPTDYQYAMGGAL